MKKKGQHVHPYKRFFGGKLLTGILLVIFLVALVIFAFNVFTPLSDNEKIKIAALLPLSGENEVTGLSYQKGIDMALSELQNRGKNIEIIYFDTKNNPKLALDSFFEIINQNIYAVLGPVTTGEAEVIAPYAEMYNIPIITYATGSSLAKYNNYIFRFNPSNNNYCNAIMELLKELNISNLSVVWSETSLGKSAYENINEAANKENINIISIPITSIDDVVDKLSKTKTEIAYVEAESVEQINDILEAQKYINSSYPNCWITTDSGFGNSIRDSDFDRGVIFTIVPTVSTADPIFLEKYEEKYEEIFDVADGYILIGYDSLMTLVNSIPVQEKRNGEKIAESLKEDRYLGLTGPIFFDKNNQRFPAYELYVPLNNKWISVPLREFIDGLDVMLKLKQGHKNIEEI